MPHNIINDLSPEYRALTAKIQDGMKAKQLDKYNARIKHLKWLESREKSKHSSVNCNTTKNIHN